MNLISVTRIRRSRRKISTTLPKEVADLVGIGEEDKLLGWAEKDGKIYLVPECEVKEFLREKLYGLREVGESVRSVGESESRTR